jgi:putative ABC transport system substrate-binding protein
MRRRDFIAGLGGVAAWPLSARAQQADRMRRIAVLFEFDENDPVAKGYLSAFMQGLAELGWTDGRNMRIDVRWGAGNVDRMRMLAKELIDLQPELILTSSTPVTAAVQRETRTIPIVFVFVSDPVGAGFVPSLPRPGGNITGFGNQEPSMGGKWLGLLAEIAPTVKRAAMMFNPDTAPYVRSYFLPSFEAAARSLKVEPIVARFIATPKSKRSSPRCRASRTVASSSCRTVFCRSIGRRSCCRQPETMYRRSIN